MYIQGKGDRFGLGELQGKHSAVAKDFPDPENCWAPGATGKPNWSKTILKVGAELDVPAKCSGSIIARTILRDVTPVGGAVDFAEGGFIGFGVSDGTNTGGADQPTRIDAQAGTVEFAKTIPWNGASCTASDLFVYVKYLTSDRAYTFIEIGFCPRIASRQGTLIDNSPAPVIRLNPCNNLAPIRSPYPVLLKRQYLSLPAADRKKTNAATDAAFVRETGVSRRLNMQHPDDRRLAQQWWRIKDEVMAR